MISKVKANSLAKPNCLWMLFLVAFIACGCYWLRSVINLIFDPYRNTNSLATKKS